MKYWIEKIQKKLDKDGLKHDPRHIIGFMEYGLKSWSNASIHEINREYLIACGCMAECTLKQAEDNAVSFGL